MRFQEIDWAALPEGATTEKVPVKHGAPMLRIDDLKKYGEVKKLNVDELFGYEKGSTATKAF